MSVRLNRIDNNDDINNEFATSHRAKRMCTNARYASQSIT